MDSWNSENSNITRYVLVQISVVACEPNAFSFDASTYTFSCNDYFFLHFCIHFKHLNLAGAVWEPPTVKRALLNQRSPWHLQCPLVIMPPTGKSIKMWLPKRWHPQCSVLSYCTRKTANASTGQSAAGGTSPVIHQARLASLLICIFC
jgi:hypothetical protein